MSAHEEIMNALAFYFGDGEGLNPSEESIREIISQDHDPIEAIAKALDYCRGSAREVVFIGEGEGQPFSMGGVSFIPANEPESESLLALANHMRGSMNGLPDEWQPWALEIEQSIRKSAFTTATAIGNAFSKSLESKSLPT